MRTSLDWTAASIMCLPYQGAAHLLQPSSLTRVVMIMMIMQGGDNHDQGSDNHDHHDGGAPITTIKPHRGGDDHDDFDNHDQGGDNHDHGSNNHDHGSYNHDHHDGYAPISNINPRPGHKPY